MTIREPVWDYMGRGSARRVVSLASFCLIYTLLVLLGLLLRESSQQLTILWQFGQTFCSSQRPLITEPVLTSCLVPQPLQ